MFVSFANLLPFGCESISKQSVFQPMHVRNIMTNHSMHTSFSTNGCAVFMHRSNPHRCCCERTRPIGRYDGAAFAGSAWKRRFTTSQDYAAGQTSRDKGLAFEVRVERVMGALGCDLVQTQASMDGGIDHIGRWNLPDLELEVVTQCKNEQKPVGVAYLREFYGVLGVRSSPTTLAVFFSASGYSIYAQRFFARTLHPAILCTIADDDRIVEFLLNDRARAALPRLAVGSSFVDHEHELILTYGDRVLGTP